MTPRLYRFYNWCSRIQGTMVGKAQGHLDTWYYSLVRKQYGTAKALKGYSTLGDRLYFSSLARSRYP